MRWTVRRLEKLTVDGGEYLFAGMEVIEKDNPAAVMAFLW
jgi:hypothetical protein